ncbi:hypothetical protein BZG05_13010 [Salinivibrio kushneri]|nr:hypothetical protein BZG05_13010 [Salinivibrio kushneri]
MLAQDIGYEFLSSHTIKLKEPVQQDGVRITIRRDTDLRDRAVDFVNAAELTEADLDNSAAQVFYAMQEAQDNSQDTIAPDPVGNWDIHDRNIVNLRAGDKPHHAVNKAQLDKKDAEWNQLDQSMKESIETMGNQIIEAKEHVNMAGLKSSEAQDQADRAYTQADRAEDEADRAQMAQNATGHLRDEVQTQKELAENYNNEIRDMHGEIETYVTDAQGYKVTAVEAASQTQSNADAVQRDREAVTNLRDDVENRQDKVVEKHIAVQTLHNATKQYRDEAQLIAGKAENYVVDYGVWNPKLGLPPKPATSARWKASQGGTVEGIGVFRAGDWLDYSVKTDKFYREGNVLSVNGRSGDLTLNHEDVGAFSRAEANNRFLFKDEKAVDATKFDGLETSQFVRSDQDTVSTGKLTLQRKGCALDIGGGSILDDNAAYIRMGNDDYPWKINYNGTTQGTPGNEFQIVSETTSKGIQLDHDGNFELKKGDEWEKVATVNSDISGNAATATNAQSSADSEKLNGRADHYHPENKPTPTDLGAEPSLNATQKRPIHIGTEPPAADFGSEGDIYIEYKEAT